LSGLRRNQFSGMRYITSIIKQVRLVCLGLTKSSGRRLLGFYPPAVPLPYTKTTQKVGKLGLTVFLKTPFSRLKPSAPSPKTLTGGDNK